MRDHLKTVARSSGKTPDDLKRLTGTPCPPSMAYLWEAFLDLSGSRPRSENGPGAIEYQEIKWWAELTHKPITAWQVEVIKRLDAVFLTVDAENDRRD